MKTVQELLEHTRLIHHRVASGCGCQQEDHPCCWYCYEDWPCLSAQLAYALALVQARADAEQAYLDAEREKNTTLTSILEDHAQHRNGCATSGYGVGLVSYGCDCGLSGDLYALGLRPEIITPADQALLSELGISV